MRSFGSRKRLGFVEEICRFRVGALTQRPIVSNANNNGGTPFLSEKLGAFLSEELGAFISEELGVRSFFK